jgi:hypothetical protein
MKRGLRLVALAKSRSRWRKKGGIIPGMQKRLTRVLEKTLPTQVPGLWHNLYWLPRQGLGNLVTVQKVQRLVMKHSRVMGDNGG